MAKLDDDTPDGGHSQTAEQVVQDESSSQGLGRAADVTAERRENQAKPPVQVTLLKALEVRVAQIQRNTEHLMAEKEELMLNFVFAKVPRPYYVRWKEESNAIFAQAVAINRRRKSIRKRNDAAAAAKKPA